MIKVHGGRELRRIIIFGIVGISATTIHMLVAHLFYAVIEDRIPASLAGFCLAFVFSYLAHRRFTFHDAIKGSPFRFFIVAGSGFLFSLFVLDHLADGGGRVLASSARAALAGRLGLGQLQDVHTSRLKAKM